MKKMSIKSLVILLFTVFVIGCNMHSPKGVITDVTPVSKKLTLMIYMAADNDLEKWALKNLKQMERAGYEELNVVVLLDRSDGYDETDGNWTDTRLFEVTHDRGNGSGITSKRLSCEPLGLSASANTELDTGDWTVLKTFIEFSKEAYPAENYALIMWGHGAGIGSFAVDDRSKNSMILSELKKAVSNQGLCVIGFDTCFGGVLECVYELKDCAPFITGCPRMAPSQGWDYTMLLEEIEKESMEEKQIALSMSRASSIPAFVFDMSKVTGLFQNFEAFARELSYTINDSQSQQQMFETLYNSKSYNADTYPCDMFLEIRALASLFISSNSQNLNESAAALIQTIDNTLSSPNGTAAEVSVYFVPLESAGVLTGTHPSDYVKNQSNTSQCSFVKQSQWWVPTSGENSGSVLDKLFYTSF